MLVQENESSSLFQVVLCSNSIYSLNRPIDADVSSNINEVIEGKSDSLIYKMDNH